MNKKLLVLLLSLIGGFAAVLSAQNIKNPVLPNVADAGVMKYNGKYYIGGVHTDGDCYYSSDLVNWQGPVHIITMNNDWTRNTGAGNDQIHANDMIYHNGTFHAYWSVNYWGRDRHAVHITHAESDSVLGPYVEPVKDTWLENRIDAKVFKDDDGQLYMYLVKFTDGNTIWARPMSDPRTFSGPPVCQFGALAATWEKMDNKVAEGPWVIKYRDRYYMMYNANHTGTDWGNYQLGVAEADSPTTFNHGSKYPYPLMGSNQTTLEENYHNLLLFKNKYEPEFSYQEQEPPTNWRKLTYQEGSDWKKGKMGFAANPVEGSSTNPYGTRWTSGQLFLRKVFVLDKRAAGNLALRVKHNGATKVYLNDKLVYQGNGRDYKMVSVSDAVRKELNNGLNVLAVETTKGNIRNFFDVSLFGIGQEKVDDILFTPGQPNILRGPNGFEWWHIYMANKNNEPRSQYINRIHFLGKTMYADGITAAKTSGYYPNPSQPTYSHLEELKLGQDSIRLIAEEKAGTNYLLETAVNTQANAGVVVWYKDPQNWIKVGLDRERHRWYYKTSVVGIVLEDAYALPSDFRFGVYHSLRIERNLNTLMVCIDDIPAPGKHRFNIPFSEKACPGVFADDPETTFEGLIYTRGWDEYDAHIVGWGNAESGRKIQGDVRVSEEGLQAQTDAFEAFKGDELSNYEFSLQIDNPSDKGIAGVYPIYVDDSNYLRVGFNYHTRRLEIDGVEEGKAIETQTYPLKQMRTYYADMRYSDFMEKVFSMHSSSWIDGIWLNRAASHNKDFVVDNMYDQVTVDYRKEGKWQPVFGKYKEASNRMYTALEFAPLRTDGLRIINKSPTDRNPYVYKIRVSEVFKQSYNLRSVVLKDELLLIVDGQLIARIPHRFGPSQVGLFAEGCQPGYNGILVYELNN